MRSWRVLGATACLAAGLVAATSQAASAAPTQGPPPLMGVSADGVALGATETVQVSGDYFQPGMTITPDDAGLTITNVVLSNDDDTATFRLAVARTVAVGYHSATFTNPDGGSRDSVALVVDADPSLASISPSQWVVGEQGGQLTLTGAAISTDTVLNAGPGITFTANGGDYGSTVDTIGERIAVAPGTAPVQRDLTLTNGDGGVTTVSHALALVSGNPSPPGAVTNLQVAGDTVTWAAPAPTSGSLPVTGYDVTYAGIGVDIGPQSVQVDAATRSFSVPVGCADLQVSVAGINQNGTGPTATSVTAVPRPPIPSTYDIISSPLVDGAALTWRVNDCSPGTATFSVALQPADGSVVVAGDGATITGLTPGTHYTAIVTAANGTGSSQDLAYFTASGVPAVPTGITLALTRYGAGFVPQLSWIPGDGAGLPITGFDAIVVGPNFRSEEGFLPTATTSLLRVSGSGNYEVALQECNDLLCSEYSDPLSITVPPLNTAPITVTSTPAGGSATTVEISDLRVTTPHPEELAVTWSSNAVASDGMYYVDLTGYLKNGQHDKHFFTDSPSAFFTGLIPGDKYVIKVSAFSGTQGVDASVTGRPYGAWQLSKVAVHPATAKTKRSVSVVIASAAATPRVVLQTLRGGRWVTVGRLSYDSHHHLWTTSIGSLSGEARIVVAATTSYHQAVHSFTVPRSS